MPSGPSGFNGGVAHCAASSLTVWSDDSKGTRSHSRVSSFQTGSVPDTETVVTRSPLTHALVVSSLRVPSGFGQVSGDGVLTQSSGGAT